MLKNTLMNKKVQHIIDLTKSDDDGVFLCPKCAVVISPDDETSKVYKIEDVKVKNNELVELTLRCKKCKTNMKLLGFHHTIDS